MEIICNAGFMRLLTAEFVEAWRDRQLNIHPSLLPAFRGLHPQQQALDAGVCISGATVHFVRAEMDAGPILAQAAVPVRPDDNAEDACRAYPSGRHRIYRGPWRSSPPVPLGSTAKPCVIVPRRWSGPCLPEPEQHSEWGCSAARPLRLRAVYHRHGRPSERLSR